MPRPNVDSWTALFLTTTLLTSVSGFGFLSNTIIPLVVLAIAIAAQYAFHMAGAWRSTYAVGPRWHSRDHPVA
ncbi:MAG: hypothetical protein WBE37_28115 [Bryobacteraceae bacterium]